MTDDIKSPIFWLETLWKCIIITLLITGIMISLSTLLNENTYCKITPKYTYGNVTQYSYQPKQEIRIKEAGFVKTHYGLGTMIIANQTMAKEIECKTKFLKYPLNNEEDIKNYIFGGN